MQDPPTEGGVLLAVTRIIHEILGFPISAYDEFLPHETKEKAEVGPLLKECGESRRIHRGENPSGKIFTLNRNNGDGGLFGRADSENRRDDRARETRLGRGHANARGELKGGGDAGDGREMKRLEMMRPCDVQQEHVRLDPVRRPVILDDGFVQRYGGETTG